MNRAQKLYDWFYVRSSEYVWAWCLIDQNTHGRLHVLKHARMTLKCIHGILNHLGSPSGIKWDCKLHWWKAHTHWHGLPWPASNWLLLFSCSNKYLSFNKMPDILTKPKKSKIVNVSMGFRCIIEECHVQWSWDFIVIVHLFFISSGSK